MRRINTTTKGKITDANGKSFDGFVQRDPRVGEQSTHLSDSWCNNLQEEICNVIEGVGGHTVSGSDVQVEKYDQMFQAIKLLVDTATPIGSVKAMPIKMSDSYMARWVPIDEDEAGGLLDTGRVAYLSKEMAKNCEKVEGDTEGWYKLVTGNKENGEASGAFGWALADGTFPLPISSFGEDDGTRPKTEEEKNKIKRIISDTEYGKFWWVATQNDTWWSPLEMSDVWGTDYRLVPSAFPDISRYYEYYLRDQDFLPPKDDTPIDLGIWTAKKTKKPKLIPNLNDKTFLMGSNEENLPFTVEGKNGFMMKPYHMPPHRHSMKHDHTATCSEENRHDHKIYDIDAGSGSDHGVHSEVGTNYSRNSANREGWTQYTPAHKHNITVDEYFDYSWLTGGYRMLPEYFDKFPENIKIRKDDNLYGNVPIDLRPKRLAVYYYIRVI